MFDLFRKARYLVHIIRVTAIKTDFTYRTKPLGHNSLNALHLMLSSFQNYARNTLHCTSVPFVDATVYRDVLLQGMVSGVHKQRRSRNFKSKFVKFSRRLFRQFYTLPGTRKTSCGTLHYAFVSVRCFHQISFYTLLSCRLV